MATIDKSNRNPEERDGAKRRLSSGFYLRVSLRSLGEAHPSKLDSQPRF